MFAIVAICIISCATLFLLAKHTNTQYSNAARLNFTEITTPKLTNTTQQDLTVVIQAINPSDVSPNLTSLNFIKTTRFNNRYQAFRMLINNKSPDAHALLPSKTSIPFVPRETIIACLDQSTSFIPALAGIGTPILLIAGMHCAFFPSLLVGATVGTGVALHLKSYKNKSTLTEYIINHVVDDKHETVISSYSSLDTLFFLKKNHTESPITLQLKNTKTNTIIEFKLNLTEQNSQ